MASARSGRRSRVQRTVRKQCRFRSGANRGYLALRVGAADSASEVHGVSSARVSHRGVKSKAAGADWPCACRHTRHVPSAGMLAPLLSSSLDCLPAGMLPTGTGDARFEVDVPLPMLGTGCATDAQRRPQISRCFFPRGSQRHLPPSWSSRGLIVACDEPRASAVCECLLRPMGSLKIVLLGKLVPAADLSAARCVTPLCARHASWRMRPDCSLRLRLWCGGGAPGVLYCTWHSMISI